MVMGFLLENLMTSWRKNGDTHVLTYEISLGF